MTKFLIDEPHHKRWMLPDGIHAINSVIYGNEMMDSVIDVRTNKLCESYTFAVDRNDLHEQFCALAERKYRRHTIVHRNDPINFHTCTRK